LDGKSLIVGAAYGAATTVIESAGVMAAAYALDRPDMKGVTRLFDEAADKMGIHEGDKVSTPLQMAATFLGGAAVSLFLRDRAVVGGRSRRDNIKYGLMTSGALGAVCAVQGAALDSGIDAPGLGTIGMAAGAVASVVGTVRWAKSYTHKTKETDTKSQITIDNTNRK
jgi:hypothetical protein